MVKDDGEKIDYSKKENVKLKNSAINNKMESLNGVERKKLRNRNYYEKNREKINQKSKERYHNSKIHDLDDDDKYLKVLREKFDGIIEVYKILAENYELAHMGDMEIYEAYISNLNNLNAKIKLFENTLGCDIFDILANVNEDIKDKNLKLANKQTDDIRYYTLIPSI